MSGQAEWVEILWGFMKFFFKHMLKVLILKKVRTKVGTIFRRLLRSPFTTSIIKSNVCQKIVIFSLLFLLSNLKYNSNKCFQDKMWIEMSKWIFWESNLETPIFIFYVFITKIIWRTFDAIIDNPYLMS